MASKERLIVLVHKVFYYQKTSNIVNQSILLSWMNLNSVRILSIVAKRVIHFDHLLLTLLLIWLLHRSNISRILLPLFCSKDA